MYGLTIPCIFLAHNVLFVCMIDSRQIQCHGRDNAIYFETGDLLNNFGDDQNKFKFNSFDIHTDSSKLIVESLV